MDFFHQQQDVDDFSMTWDDDLDDNDDLVGWLNHPSQNILVKLEILPNRDEHNCK